MHSHLKNECKNTEVICPFMDCDSKQKRKSI